MKEGEFTRLREFSVLRDQAARLHDRSADPELRDFLKAVEQFCDSVETQDHGLKKTVVGLRDDVAALKEEVRKLTRDPGRAGA